MRLDHGHVWIRLSVHPKETLASRMGALQQSLSRELVYRRSSAPRGDQRRRTGSECSAGGRGRGRRHRRPRRLRVPTRLLFQIRSASCVRKTAARCTIAETPLTAIVRVEGSRISPLTASIPSGQPLPARSRTRQATRASINRGRRRSPTRPVAAVISKVMCSILLHQGLQSLGR